MSTVRKFEFGQSFDKPLVAPSAVETVVIAAEPEVPPEPTYLQADLDAAEARGFLAGQLEGNRQALAREEHQVALAIADIAGVFPSLADQLRAGLGDIERQAAATLLMAVERVLPALVQETGRREMALLLDRAFERAIEEPRVTVRCADAQRDALDAMIRAAAAQAGFAGKLMIIGDPAISAAGCRIEWSEGGVEREPAALLAAIEAALRRGLETTGSSAPSRAPAASPTHDLGP